MGFLGFILYVSSHHPHIFQTFIFLFCFLSYFLDLVFHPFLFELSFYFNEIFIVSCPCFRDAIPSYCSLRIFIRTWLVAVLEVFFCLLYYLCFSQIPLFSFAFLLWFLSFRMKAFLICLVTFDCLSVFKNWLKVQRPGKIHARQAYIRVMRKEATHCMGGFPKSVHGGLFSRAIQFLQRKPFFFPTLLGIKLVCTLSRER